MSRYSLALRAYGLIRPFGRRCPDGIFGGNSAATAGEANALLIGAIKENIPFCVSRLGGVEAKIISWSDRIRLRGRIGAGWPTFFWETQAGATNAGIRPRDRTSYRYFGQLAGESLAHTDVLGVWFTDYEDAVIRSKALACYTTEGRAFAPTNDVDPHWIHALGDLKMLVISPFEQSIRQQVKCMNAIWKARDLRWTSEVEVVRFPYLIDDSCSLDWRDVFREFRAKIYCSDASIVICGCGGLGLLLAAEAKKAGKIGLHLGGFAQLLFGLHGKRHLEQEWHKKYFNDAWIRPLTSEKAESAVRVEGGCYW